MRVLILEENQSEIKLIESILKDSGNRFESKSAKTEKEFIKFVNRFKPDIIISGTNLSKYSVHEALEFLKEQELLIPFILITGNISDDLAKDYLKQGADEYLTKFNLLSLPAIIIKAIEFKKTQREKKSAEQLVKSKDAQLMTFYNNNPESIFELGFGCEILNMNASASELLEHFGEARSKKWKFTDFLLNDDIKVFKEAHSNVCRGQKRNITLRLKSSKEEHWLDCKIVPVLNEEKNVSAVLIIGINVTDKVKTEKALSKSQSDFQLLLTIIDDSIWSIDKDLKLDFFNEMADRLYYKISGRNLKTGMTLKVFAGSEEREKFWMEKLGKVLSGEKISLIDEMNIDGTTCYFSLTIYPTIFDNQIKGATIVSHEITSFVKAEEQLKKSEELFRTVSESAPIGIFQIDKNANCSYANKVLQNMIGAPFNELKDKNWKNLFSQPELDLLKSEWKKQTQSKSDFSMTLRYQTKSGIDLWLEIRSTILDRTAPDDKIIYMGTVNDITELKKANELLKENQILLDIIDQSTTFGFYYRDAQDVDAAWWSDSNFKIYDRAKEKGPLPFRELVETVHPSDREDFEEGTKKLIAGEVMDTEYRIITPRQKLKYLHTIAHPLKDEDGKIVRFLGSTHDKTGLKEHELESENQKFLLRKAFEIARIGTWEYDLNSGRVLWSKELKKIMGMKESERTPSFEVFNAMIHPQHRELMQQAMQEQLLNGEPSSIEYSIHTSGEIKNILSISHAIRDENDVIIKLSGVAMDISNTRRTEKKLKATEELFNSFFENAPDAVLIESEDGTILNANKNACLMKGLNRTDIIGKNLLDLIPKEHHVEVMKNFKAMFSGSSNSLRTKTWNISGHEIPIHIKATKILYKNQPALLLNIRNDDMPI